MEYNYLEEMVSDIKEWLSENDIEEVTEDNFDEIYENLFIEDSVTGNASGSYTFSAHRASQYVVANTDLAKDAMEAFGILPENAYDWEYMDVSIRCYLLGEALNSLLV